MTQNQYQIKKQKIEFNGYFQIIKYWLRTSLFNGSESKTFTREVFERGHAVGLIPYDKKHNKILLIEQFRPGAMTTPFSPWIVEPIAGIIEKDETPKEVVKREAMEEAGIKVKDIKKIYHYLISPGGSSETLALYAASCDLSEHKNHQIYGLKYENEDIKTHIMSLDKAVKKLEKGELNNAMAIIAIQWLEKNWKKLK